ncbi:hypothetical protein [Salimicrobium jeotgali]|nr:hypothetical protein [Salimicrobium jeotgali]MBM7697671.1 hypothetical protein [Salimicrobium jeotgali]
MFTLEEFVDEVKQFVVFMMSIFGTLLNDGTRMSNFSLVSKIKQL